MTETKKSAVEIAESTKHGQIELAAADVMLEAAGLLNRAVRTAGVSQRDLAEALGVGESRVSQVLNGDGNLRLTTLARYLRAAGYSISLTVNPADHDTPALPKPRVRVRKSPQTKTLKVWTSSVVDSEGAGEALTFALTSSHNVCFGEPVPLAELEPDAAVADLIQGKALKIPVYAHLPVRNRWQVSMDKSAVTETSDRSTSVYT